MIITLEEALRCNRPVTVHTVSGEYYEGTCLPHTHNKLLFGVKSEDQIFTLPVWSVKRIHSCLKSKRQSPQQV
ncbi:hypothetical protein GCM10010969_35780 [Saccharibacillus kuerlensis]|uniref:Uncharacterized protein n=1 Tax=Saccharibacillus kuerlensis TaxID=459527 RepID=A0ABQ2L927_9BACL|nr:hypothetical protein GCM10010969_35780 [Saccharibacillus kuerlensis]